MPQWEAAPASSPATDDSRPPGPGANVPAPHTKDHAMTSPAPALPNGAPLLASPGARIVKEGDGHVLIRASRVAILHSMAGGQYYRSGHNSWSPSGWSALDGPPLRIADPERRTTADDPSSDDPFRHHGSWMGAVARGEDGEALLVGALDGAHPCVRCDEDTLVGFDPGGDALWMVAWGDEQGVFDSYTAALAPRALPRRPAPRVWCSWYSYYEKVTWRDIEEQLDSLAGLGYRTVQIDDGWQAGVGDWRPNAKFGDLAECARRIRDHGMTPGLWVAPFIAREGAPLLEAHPEAFVHGPDGSPVVAGYNWGGPYYALDTTHPTAQHYLRGLVRTLVGAGIGYLKLDFINAAAVPGQRFQDAWGDEAYRLGCAVIREEAPDAYLLGSGALVIPSIGVLDGIRVSCDVAPIWKSYATEDPSDAEARNAFKGSVARLWLRSLIDVDPDVVFFRHVKNLLNDQQIEWLRDVAAVARFKSSSDPVAWLTDEEKGTARAWLARDEDIERVSRNTWRIDGREVDFGPGLARPEHCYPVS